MASRLSLAAKLYSIFALFAVLTAAIAVLSDYNTRRATELTHAIETANLAALNVERVNSLVYAVVMESRGVYMSTDPAVVKKFGEGLLKFNDNILNVVKKWEAIVQADDSEQFATFKKRIEQFVEFRKELVRRANEISPAAGREWGDNDANRSVRSALNKDLEALSKVYVERGRRIAEQTETNHQLSFVLTCLGGFALLLVVLGIIIISRSIARPLSAITATIKHVAEGAEHVEVPHTDRGDEIGALARAIKIFQEAMERNRKLAAQVSEESSARQERARQIEDSVEEFRQAIGAVLHALTDNASAMRNTAQTINRVASGANEQAVAASGATNQASGNVSAVAGAAEELSASVQEIGRQVQHSADAVRQTGQRTEKSIAEIESLAAATQRIDGVLTLIQAIARADQSPGAERHHRGRARRRCRPRLCGGRPRGQGARRPDREGDRRDRPECRVDPEFHQERRRRRARDRRRRARDQRHHLDHCRRRRRAECRHPRNLRQCAVGRARQRDAGHQHQFAEGSDRRDQHGGRLGARDLGRSLDHGGDAVARGGEVLPQSAQRIGRGAESGVALRHPRRRDACSKPRICSLYVPLLAGAEMFRRAKYELDGLRHPGSA